MSKNDYVTARELDRLYEQLDRIENVTKELAQDVANINGRLMMVPTLISIATGVFSFLLNFFVIKKS